MTMNNLEKHKNDLEHLIQKGKRLLQSVIYACDKERFEESVRKEWGNDTEKFLNNLPSFYDEYQSWYSEAKVVVRQILPDRLDDFVSHYEIPRVRKGTRDTYRIWDYLSGNYSRFSQAAVYHFKQQLEIVKSIQKRFESSLFDIVRIVQADLFDSELDSARALVEGGFLRAGGAMAGVVMERHLAQVCKNHKITIRKKNLTISDFNDKLKNEGVIDIPRWRLNQGLGDIRNLCTHNKDTKPTKENVEELINGVDKVTKTLF